MTTRRNGWIERGRMGVLIFGIGTLIRLAFPDRLGGAVGIAVFAAGTLIAGAAWLWGLHVESRTAP